MSDKISGVITQAVRDASGGRKTLDAKDLSVDIYDDVLSITVNMKKVLTYKDEETNVNMINTVVHMTRLTLENMTFSYKIA